MARSSALACFLLLLAVACTSQSEVTIAAETSLRDEAVVVLSGVDIIDGTGAPLRRNQVVVLDGERIAAVGDVGAVALPQGAQMHELSGHTLIPGIVGMHNHTHMPGIPFLGEVAALLNLASGVTTIQTAGSAQPDAELELAAAIDRGELAGPTIFPSSQYITGPGGSSAMIQPASPADAKRIVEQWASKGFTWIKLYRRVEPVIAKAVIETAHERGLRVTGHLCSLTFREATAMGIDRIEHGLISASDFHSQKKAGVCPSGNVARIAALDLESAEVRDLISFLVESGVTLTSTLAITESHFPHRTQGNEATLRFMSPEQIAAYEERQRRLASGASQSVFTDQVWRKMLAFELAFVRAGGHLVAGPDTGRHVLPGSGDRRNFELLREAGFGLEETVKIMTHNGAVALGVGEEIGTIETGKRADLVMLRGTPSTLDRVTAVFKAGTAYDPDELLNGLEGRVGAVATPVR